MAGRPKTRSRETIAVYLTVTVSVLPLSQCILHAVLSFRLKSACHVVLDGPPDFQRRYDQLLHNVVLLRSGTFHTPEQMSRPREAERDAHKE
jgi:hypothetical protein